MSNESSFPRDQATLLRMMAKRAILGSPATIPKVRSIVLFGGTGNAGVTTLCYNLACAYGLAGHRVAAVDLNLDNGALGELACHEQVVSLDELITTHADLHEYLVPGFAASLILPTGASVTSASFASGMLERFMRQLSELGRHADILLIDAGCEVTPLVRRLWALPNQFVAVLNPTADSITSGYEKIRSLNSSQPRSEIGVVMNRSLTPSGHDDLVQGIDKTSLKFLGLRVISKGHVPAEKEFAMAQTAGQPFVARYPKRIATEQIQAIAEQLTQPSKDANSMNVSGAAAA